MVDEAASQILQSRGWKQVWTQEFGLDFELSQESQGNQVGVECEALGHLVIYT